MEVLYACDLGTLGFYRIEKRDFRDERVHLQATPLHSRWGTYSGLSCGSLSGASTGVISEDDLPVQSLSVHLRLVGS